MLWYILMKVNKHEFLLAILKENPVESFKNNGVPYLP